MEQTLEPEQYVLVDKLTPRFDTYKRGDIVVFTPPADWVQDNGTPFIKRVIGVGGDTVEIRDGDVIINGDEIDEPYLYADEATGPPQTTTRADDDQSDWVIPEGELFLMGDHRAELRGLAGLRARPRRQRHRARMAPLLADRHVRDPPDADLPGAGASHAMNPALAGVALAVIVGAIVAVSARDARTAVLGLAVTLVARTGLADPSPRPSGMAARVVAAVLAVYLLWIAVRDGEAPTGGSRLGWAAEAALAAAAAIVGLRPARARGRRARARRSRRRPGSRWPPWPSRRSSPAATSSGSGSGSCSSMQGALLVARRPRRHAAALEQLVTAGLIVGLGGAVAVLATAARRDGADGLRAHAGRATAHPPPGRRARAGRAASGAGRSRCRSGPRTRSTTERPRATTRHEPRALPASSPSARPASRSSVAAGPASPRRSGSSGWSARS